MNLQYDLAIKKRVIPLMLLLCVSIAPDLALSGNETSLPTMEIAYINFGVAPYASQTREYLASYPLFKIYIYGHHSFNKELIEIFEKAEATSATSQDEKQLRLLVTMRWPQKATYLVDEHGVVLEEKSGNKFVVGKKELLSLDAKIMRFHGVVDQWPDRDVWGEDSDTVTPSPEESREGK